MLTEREIKVETEVWYVYFYFLATNSQRCVSTVESVPAAKGQVASQIC